MAKKWLVALIIILVLIALGIICRRVEVNQQNQWTQRSENLLNVKKYPKKPLKKTNLFE